MQADWEHLMRRPAGADAARVLAVGIVGWFHIWQQSWILAGKLDPIPRTGYVWVDMMILLSAFCLALPYGADRAQGLAFRGTKGFWTRRAIRILPAFYFCSGVHLIVSLAREGAGPWLFKDLVGHLTLTHTFTPEGYYFTHMGGALWTVGVLAGFYLIFPLLIRAFYTHPGITLAALLVFQEGFRVWALRRDGLAYMMVYNQLPAFAGVLALGLGCALLYPQLVKWLKGRYRPAFLLGAAFSFWLIFQYLRRYFVHTEDRSRTQLELRMPLAILFAVLLLLLCLGMGGSKKKGLLTALSGISYCFYMWHQSLAVWLKDLRIPYWQGETPPNQLGDKVWMHRYNLLCWVVAIAAAVLCTYLIEKPAARLLSGYKSAKTGEKSHRFMGKTGKKGQKA